MSSFLEIIATVKTISNLIKSPEFQSTVKVVGDAVKNVCDTASTISKQLTSLHSQSSNILQEISKVSSDISELQKLLVQSFEDLKAEIKFEFANNAVKTQETLIEALFAKSIKYAANFDSFQRPTILAFIKELSKVDIIINTYYMNIFQGDESYFTQATKRILEAQDKFVSNFETPPQIVLQKFYQSILLVQIKAFVLDTFAYVARYKLDEGNFYSEYEVAMDDFGRRIHDSLELMNKHVKNTSRWQWNTKISGDESVYSSYDLDHISYTRTGRLFSRVCLHESKSNVDENYVISGVRLMKVKYTFGINVQESKLLPNGFIDKNSSRWQPLFPHKYGWRRIFDTKLYTIDPFGNPILSVNEVKFIESESMTKANDDDYVLTGVKVLNNEGAIRFQATFHKFDHKTGKVSVEEEKKVETNVLITDDDPKVAARLAETNFTTENPIIDIRPVFSSTMAISGVALKVSQLNEKQVTFGLQIQTLPLKMHFEI